MTLSQNGIWDTTIIMKYKFINLTVVVHVLQTTQNLVNNDNGQVYDDRKFDER